MEAAVSRTPCRKCEFYGECASCELHRLRDWTEKQREVIEKLCAAGDVAFLGGELDELGDALEHARPFRGYEPATEKAAS